LGSQIVFASVDTTVEHALAANEHITRVPVMKFWKYVYPSVSSITLQDTMTNGVMLVFRRGALAAQMEGSEPADVVLPWLTKLITEVKDLDSPSIISSEHVLVGFFQNAEKPEVTRNTLVDLHTTMFVEIQNKLKHSQHANNIMFAEADNLPHHIAERLGASGKVFPTFGFLTWEKTSRGTVPVTRMWPENSGTAMTADAVIEWASQCATGKACPEFIKSEADPDNKPGHLQILTGKSLDAAVAQKKDVVVYFGSTNVGPFPLLERVAQRLSGIHTVSVGRVDVFHNHVSVDLRRKLRGLGLPVLVMFPTDNKDRIQVFCSKASLTEDNVLQFIAQTASTKFVIPPPLKEDSSDGGHGDVNPYEYATRWGRIMNTIYRWLGVFWIKF
jgi:hypothetical protein